MRAHSAALGHDCALASTRGRVTLALHHVEVHELFTGTLCVDLRLGAVSTLKQKRSVVRPIVAEVQRRFAVSVAETGHQELYRRAEIGVAVVSGDGQTVRDVLDAVERLLAGRPEVEILEVRRQLFSSTDESMDGRSHPEERRT